MRLHTLERLIMISSIILYSILTALVLYSRRKGNILERIGFKKEVNVSKELLISLGYLILLIAISITVGIIFYQLGMQQDLQKAPELLKELPITEVLTVLLIGSFTEEIFFRGYLQEKTNIWVSTFIFSFFHVIYGSLAEIVGAFFLGLALGHEYRKTKGVFSPIITHVFYNLIVISMVTLA